MPVLPWSWLGHCRGKPFLLRCYRWMKMGKVTPSQRQTYDAVLQCTVQVWRLMFPLIIWTKLRKGYHQHIFKATIQYFSPLNNLSTMAFAPFYATGPAVTVWRNRHSLSSKKSPETRWLHFLRTLLKSCRLGGREEKKIWMKYLSCILSIWWQRCRFYLYVCSGVRN